MSRDMVSFSCGYNITFDHLFYFLSCYQGRVGHDLRKCLMQSKTLDVFLRIEDLMHLLLKVSIFVYCLFFKRLHVFLSNFS